MCAWDFVHLTLELHWHWQLCLKKQQKFFCSQKIELVIANSCTDTDKMTLNHQASLVWGIQFGQYNPAGLTILNAWQSWSGPRNKNIMCLLSSLTKMTPSYQASLVQHIQFSPTLSWLSWILVLKFKNTMRLLSSMTLCVLKLVLKYL